MVSSTEMQTGVRSMIKDKKEYDKYAPIAVFVYNRPDKTKALFESLSRNVLAKESDLYIFSDAAKDSRAESGVKEVRKYVQSLVVKDWFKRVTLHMADSNRGLAGSIINGVTDILDRYGRIIVLEDDLVLSAYFLTYMNECLDFYREDKRIWSIDGYSHNPVRPEGYDREVYLTYRASSWGWGTWKDRWDMVDWEVRDYGSFRFDPVANIRLKRGGNDLPSMLRAYKKGRIDSWAIRWCYSESKYNKLSLAPIKSLVSNSGIDGSGTNCKDDEDSMLSISEIEREKKHWAAEGIKENTKLVRDFYRRHHLSLYVRIRDKVKELTKG